jgi:hypothetical protein
VLDAEPELPGDGKRELHLGIREAMRRVVVNHELADQPAARDERNERERLDALGLDNDPEIAREIGRADIVNSDRFGVLCIGSPGRMALDGRAIPIGEAAPGHEPHHPCVVEQQDRCALAAKRCNNRLERGIVDFRRVYSAIEPIGEFIQGGLLVPAPGHGLFGALAIGDVDEHVDGAR